MLFILPRIVIADSLLVLGDSLSAAYGFELDQGWVHLLQKKIHSQTQNGSSWQVVNASVSGETTAGGLARLPQLLRKYEPTVTIIALGANDGLRGQSVKSMHANLAAMVKNSKQFGDVILLGMRLPPNYGRSYTKAFAETYTSVASEYKIDYVPFFIDGVTEQPEFMQADNFHPNEHAQPRILANVWPTINSVVEKISNKNVKVKR